MAKVLIVSRTQMSNGVCVGGINEDTNELIRIHDAKGGNLTFDAQYQIGDQWEMVIEKAWNRRPKPHVEDTQTIPIQKINNIGYDGIINYIRTHQFGKQITCGKLQDTFERCLHLCGTRNFINEDNVPSFSTQFWIADQNLIHKELFGKHYYIYNHKQSILKTFSIAEFKKNIALVDQIHIIKNPHGQLFMAYGGEIKGNVDGDKIPKHPVISAVLKEGIESYILHEEGILHDEEIRIKFVGYQDPVDVIPSDTIIRLSLANWWNGDGSGENRCYLQLSGWYSTPITKEI